MAATGWTRTAGALAVLGVAVACQFGGTDSGGGQASLGNQTEGGGSATTEPSGTGNVDNSSGEAGPGTSGTAETSATAETGTAGGNPVCQSTCTPDAPAGWDGPRFVAVGTSERPTPCPVGYEESAVGFLGLEAPPAECDCQCLAAGGGCTMAYDFFTFSNCTLPIGPSGDLAPNQCQPLIVAETLSGHVRGQINAEAGDCQPEASSVVSPPTWASSQTVCTPPALSGDCGDEVCVPAAPAGFDNAACITADGDVDCPQGAYSDRTVIYQGLLDDRACTECSCTVAQPPTCSGALEIYAANSCSGTPDTLPADGSCYSANASGAFGLSFNASVGTTVCDPTPSVAQGSATRTNALTVCCTP